MDVKNLNLVSPTPVPAKVADKSVCPEEVASNKAQKKHRSTNSSLNKPQSTKQAAARTISIYHGSNSSKMQDLQLEPAS